MGSDFQKTLEAAKATPPREDTRDPGEGWNQAGVLAGELEKMAVEVEKKEGDIANLLQEKRELDHYILNLKIDAEIQQKRIGELQERMADQATRQLEAVSRVSPQKSPAEHELEVQEVISRGKFPGAWAHMDAEKKKVDDLMKSFPEPIKWLGDAPSCSIQGTLCSKSIKSREDHAYRMGWFMGVLTGFAFAFALMAVLRG